MHYPNTIRSHLVTIVPIMAPFTQWCSGNFSLVGTLAGIMITYPVGVGGGYKSMFKHWEGIFLDNGRYCNTSRLRCRSYGAYTALFNFIGAHTLVASVIANMLL